MHATDGLSNDEHAALASDYKVFGRESSASSSSSDEAPSLAAAPPEPADDPFASFIPESRAPASPWSGAVASEAASTSTAPAVPAQAPLASAATSAPDAHATEARPEWYRDAAFWVHLLPIAGSVMILTGFGLVPALLIENTAGKRDEFVRDQAREALNFQLNLALVNLVALVIFWLAPFVWPFSLAFGIVLPIQAAIDVHQGRRHRYPLVPRWLD